jgi:hypothetical protein
METRLYRIEAGGATYWVSALTGADVIALVRAEDGNECEPGDFGEARELTDAEAERATFRSDEDGADRSMLAEWRRDPSPRVVACSEW